MHTYSIKSITTVEHIVGVEELRGSRRIIARCPTEQDAQNIVDALESLERKPTAPTVPVDWPTCTQQLNDSVVCGLHAVAIMHWPNFSLDFPVCAAHKKRAEAVAEATGTHIRFDKIK